MTVVETFKLSKYYNGFPALDEIDLEIPSGIVGLVGANGAGKTTLLRILLGILPPTSGEVFVFNEPINTAEVRQQIGYMSELDSFFPDLTSMRLLGHLGQMSGLPRTGAIQRAHDILTFVGLGEERHRQIRTFSKGMVQKMKLAQALVHSPKLLLLDEPTDGLDPESRQKMLKLIQKLHQQHEINIIISTHILPDIQRIGQQSGFLIVIHKGKVLLTNKLDDFLNRYENTVILEIEGKLQDRRNYFETLESLNLSCRYLTPEKLEVRLGGSSNQYQQINKTALETGIRILSISRQSFTLDQAFLEIFQDDKEMQLGQVPGR